MMTDEQRDQHGKAMRKIGLAIADQAGTMTPFEFQSWIAALLAAITSAMPDEYWKKFIYIGPCGKPGCDCHLTIAPKVIAALSAIREDYLRWQSGERTVAE